MLTVVYDACVLYPAPLRDLLMHLALRISQLQLYNTMALKRNIPICSSPSLWTWNLLMSALP